jgi:hypothetical protein
MFLETLEILCTALAGTPAKQFSLDLDLEFSAYWLKQGISTNTSRRLCLFGA